MNCFITGAGGFVGPHLVRALRAEGHLVHVFVRPRAGRTQHIPGASATHHGDLLDFVSVRNAVEAARPDAIFHLAAQSHVGESWKQPGQTLRVNVEGTVNVLEAVRATAPEAVVQLCGSSEEYGLVAENECPITEAQPLRPLSPYAVSKVTTDLLGYQYHRSYGLRVVRTRAFNHEGPGRPDSFAPSTFAAQIARIEAGVQTPDIKHGNLDAIRDYTDVRDIVRGYVLAATKGRAGEVYNIATGTGYALRDCLTRLLNLAGMADIRLEEDPARMRPSDVPRLVGDATKIRADTGWTPRIQFDQTLSDLLDWWRARTREAQ